MRRNHMYEEVVGFNDYVAGRNLWDLGLPRRRKVTLYNLVDRYKVFGRTCYIRFEDREIKMEEVGPPETLLTIHETARRHKPEDSKL
jgi:hypothetical protein